MINDNSNWFIHSLIGWYRSSRAVPCLSYANANANAVGRQRVLYILWELRTFNFGITAQQMSVKASPNLFFWRCIRIAPAESEELWQRGKQARKMAAIP